MFELAGVDVDGGFSSAGRVPYMLLMSQAATS